MTINLRKVGTYRRALLTAPKFKIEVHAKFLNYQLYLEVSSSFNHFCSLPAAFVLQVEHNQAKYNS